MNLHNPTCCYVAEPGAGSKSRIASRPWSGLALGCLLLAALAMPAAAQETVNLTAIPLRLTVPFNFNGSLVISNHVTIAGGSNEVDLSVSGLPTGASASLDKTAFTNSGGANLTVTLANVAEGIYTFSLNAANGASNTLFITLQVADLWKVGGSTINWSDTGNWNGGVLPGANDDAVFTQAGAQSSAITNSIVDQNFNIGSLRFSQTNSSTNSQTLLINPNVTLSITGTNGLSFLRDYVSLGSGMNVTVAGQSGTLAVSNEAANITTLIDNSQTSTLDLSGLGNFKSDVSQIGLGDFLHYPNFFNMQSNGYNGVAKLYLPTVKLAMTNVIRAVYADPNNYTNGTNRAYALILGNNENQATSSSKLLLLSLGISNAFDMDSFCISGFGAADGSLNFNTNFASDNPSVFFRNTDGVSRMSMFCLADAGGPIPAGGNTKAPGVDFAGSHGYVDALVDRFIMSRDRPNSSSGCTAQSKMGLGAGIFDANTAILGDQEQGNQTNLDYCQAQLIVSNTAIFRVNSDMELGYTTAGISDLSDPGSTYGILNIGPGGTVIANTIGVGGVTKTSGLVGSTDGHGQLNQITLTSGALLVVSNNIADATPNGALGLLSFGGNSTLELFVNGTHSGAYAFVNSLTTTGSGNTIQIGAINNLTLPAQVPLIQYAVGSPTLDVSLPGGYSGTIINNGPGSTIDVYISTSVPKSVVWRGYVNNSWDTTTKNWLDPITGLHTNFANLDDVSFDDTASIPTNIALVGQLIVGNATMTNSLQNYIFSGTGSTVGSATLTKGGTGSLDVEASTELSVNVTQGTLTGAGSVNSVNISPGATMVYSGTIKAGVVCGGTGTSSGTITGLVDVQNGAVFTNLNAINGPLTLETGSFMNNSGNISDMGPTGTVSTNAFLLNVGTINDTGVANGGTLQVNGTIEDTGAGSMTLFRLNILAGATFIPGNGGLGSTTINSDGIGTVPGRLSLNSGSTTLLAVDPTNTPNSTMVFAGAQDYGPSQSVQSQNGGTLVITNIGGAPYAAGQVFNFFGNAFGGDNVIPTGTSTNSFPIIVPAAPGPGLSWDLSHLWPNGLIGVITTPVVNLTNSFAIVSGTNVVGSFSWPNANYGWVLETEVDSVTSGLNNTNWTRIKGSWTNLQEVVTNSITNGAVFYRLVYP